MGHGTFLLKPDMQHTDPIEGPVMTRIHFPLLSRGCSQHHSYGSCGILSLEDKTEVIETLLQRAKGEVGRSFIAQQVCMRIMSTKGWNLLEHLVFK